MVLVSGKPEDSSQNDKYNLELKHRSVNVAQIQGIGAGTWEKALGYFLSEMILFFIKAKGSFSWTKCKPASKNLPFPRYAMFCRWPQTENDCIGIWSAVSQEAAGWATGPASGHVTAQDLLNWMPDWERALNLVLYFPWEGHENVRECHQHTEVWD